MSALVTMPRIDVLRLARVNGVPEFHPEHHTFVPFPVHAFVIHHPDGAIVVDTGIGYGNEFIDARYPHDSVSLVDELNRCGVAERDVQLIVNSHLHFDHCGQNHALECPRALCSLLLSASSAATPGTARSRLRTFTAKSGVRRRPTALRDSEN